MAQENEHPKAGETSAHGLVWSENSFPMFEATLSSVPFFVRKIVQNRLLKALKTQAGDGGTIREETYIAALRAATPEDKMAKVLDVVQPLKTS